MFLSDLGCFGSGVYLIVYFTILKPRDTINPDPDVTDKAYAVMGLFPIVSKIAERVNL